MLVSREVGSGSDHPFSQDKPYLWIGGLKLRYFLPTLCPFRIFHSNYGDRDPLSKTSRDLISLLISCLCSRLTLKCLFIIII
jgi:hypothetical protein